MKLNVILITYRQEDYIRQTLDSILMQQTDFRYNIVVADDCSPDTTLRIIEEYAERSNVEFIFLRNEKNLGYTENYKRAFAACTAPYIAIMEGDDYWTSPQHLQHHVDFLDAHPDCSISFNRHERLFVDKGYTDIPAWSEQEDYRLITTNQLALGNQIGNLSCCVLRNRKIEDKIFEAYFFADWLLGMYLGMYGTLAQQKKVTSAYRVHDNGQWSRMGEEEQYHTLLKMISEYDSLLDYKYTDEFKLYTKRININLYGDKSLKGRLKKLIPNCIMKKYRKLRYEQ